MATVASNGMDPNDPNNQQPTTGGSGTVTNSTGGGAGAAGGGGAPAGVGGAAPRANPSNTPNVQDYLNANQNAGQNLSNRIQSNVQNQANQVNTNLNTYQNQLNNQYQPLNNQVQQGQQVAQTAFQDPTALLAAYQSSQAQSQPGNTTAAPNATDLSNYNALQNEVAGTGAYNAQQSAINQYGTSGQQDYGQLQNQLGTLNQQTNAAANPMGQNQLLQQAVGTPSYNMGQQSLDALFLQGQGNQLQQNLGNIYNNTNNAVTSANTNNQAQLQALQNMAAGNVANTQQLFQNGTWGGQPSNATAPLGLNQITTNVNNQVAAANAAAPGQLAALQQAAAANGGTGRFSTAQLAQLGLSPGQQAWGVNLTPDIGATANTATASNVADQNTMNRYNALNAIAGGPAGSGIAGYNNLFGTLGGTADQTAGGYNPISFNNTGFNTAVQNQQQALTGDVTAALQQAQGNYSNNLSPIVSPLIAGLQNGTMTPDQVNAALQKYINPGAGSPSGQPGLGSGNPIGGAGGSAPGQSVSYSQPQMTQQLQMELAPYTQAYNNYYKASGDVLGQNIGGLNPQGGANAVRVNPITGTPMTGPNS